VRSLGQRLENCVALRGSAISLQRRPPAPWLPMGSARSERVLPRVAVTCLRSAARKAGESSARQTARETRAARSAARMSGLFSNGGGSIFDVSARSRRASPPASRRGSPLPGGAPRRRARFSSKAPSNTPICGAACRARLQFNDRSSWFRFVGGAEGRIEFRAGPRLREAEASIKGPPNAKAQVRPFSRQVRRPANERFPAILGELIGGERFS